MKKRDGKITFSVFIFLLVIFYGAFVAVKLISAKIAESQISSDVVDKFGIIRGSSLKEDFAEEAIRKILRKYNVDFDEGEKDSVSVQIRGTKIHYFFRYKIVTNLIFLKKTKVVEVKEEMLNHE
jgi:hypothetical protein